VERDGVPVMGFASQSAREVLVFGYALPFSSWLVIVFFSFLWGMVPLEQQGIS